jgi:hypothetical protein
LGRGSTSRGIGSDFFALAEHRGLIAFGDFEDQGFRGVFLGKVLLQAFTQHGRVNADNTVVAGIVIRGTAKDFLSDFLFVDLTPVFQQRTVRKEKSRSRRRAERLDVTAGGHTFDEQAARVRDLLFSLR